MNIWEILLVIVVSGLCVYILVDRICRCVENGNVAKTYGQIISQKPPMNLNMNDIMEKIKEKTK